MFQDGSGTGISSGISFRLAPRAAARRRQALNGRAPASRADVPPHCRSPAQPPDADTGRGRGPRPLLPAAASLLAISSPLHSLFKVLFIFPSRYLFAIGLLLIFSFRWSLPPTLGCTRKQPDSSETGRTHGCVSVDGAGTLYGSPFNGNYPTRRAGAAPIDYNSPRGFKV